MGNRVSNRYRLAIGKEFAFNSGSTADAGVINFSALQVWASKLEGDFAPAALETGFKTNTAMPTAYETTQGDWGGQITITGTLTDNHEILLSLAMHDTTSPYAWSAKPVPASVVIMRIWDDAASTPYTVDKYSGCRLDSLVINWASGGLVNFTATFSPASYTPETSQAITGTDPGVVCGTPFNSDSITIGSNFGSTNSAKSFTITLGSEYADNASSYQNSHTRLGDQVTKFMGSLQLAVNYDAANDYDYSIDNINSTAFTSPETITLDNGVKVWEFAMPIQIETLVKADTDNQLFETTVTARLVENLDTADVPTVTVTASA